MDIELFQKWTPADNLGAFYDVENISYGNGIIISLAADPKRVSLEKIHHFQLVWNSGDVISYQVTDETYRSDCWGLEFENNGRFYTAKSSKYIDCIREKSPLVPDDIIHFTIVGIDTIIDVIAKNYPEIIIK